MEKKIAEKLKNIRMLILDVDGVMTDGSIIMDSDGREMKNFNVRDGHGLVMIQRHGIQVAILTGRTSAVVDHRAHDLKITEVYQGALNKKEIFQQILQKNDITSNAIAYMGDDIVDIPVFVIGPGRDCHQVTAYFTHIDKMSCLKLSYVVEKLAGAEFSAQGDGRAIV